jgi:hypothetical protein
MSRKSSRELINQLDNFIKNNNQSNVFSTDCIETVIVNRNYWMDRLYWKMSDLSYRFPYFQQIQDNEKHKIWSKFNINNSPNVITLILPQTNKIL